MMTDHKDKVFSGQSVEEAIDIGLAEIGLSRAEVDVQVLEEGSKGLFGLGMKEARVKLMKKAATMIAPAMAGPTGDAPPLPAARDAVPETHPADHEETARVAREIVEELLSKMHVDASISVALVAEDDNDRPTVQVDIQGDDLSILIGRKAETLNALQYMARLIIGKEVGHAVNLSVDVQGYKDRKLQSLRRMAQTFAKQAVDTGRRQYLEPMAADERRIIHLELRNHPEVYTESTGEGDRRKVTINPKN